MLSISNAMRDASELHCIDVRQYISLAKERIQTGRGKTLVDACWLKPDLARPNPCCCCSPGCDTITHNISLTHLSCLKPLHNTVKAGSYIAMHLTINDNNINENAC